MTADIFADRLAQWRDYTGQPWARIRYAVVAEVLRRHTAELGDGLRILDVGGGDGLDAIPLARAGHDVTILDPTAGWLVEAHRRAEEAGTALTTLEGGLDDLPPGEWDLVLCHFVLRYRNADAADVAKLARCVRPGGRLSLVDANPAATVLFRLTRQGPAAALDELGAETVHGVTFDHDTRKYAAEDAEAEMADAGLRVIGRYGTRIANDLLTDDGLKHDPAYFQRLLDLELALCDREPYCRIGGAWQLVAERPGTPS